MEGAGNESFPRYAAIPETANGNIWLAADVAGLLFHRILLSTTIRCDASHTVVGGALISYMEHLPYTCQMDCRVAHSLGSHHHYECRFGLLGLLSKAKRAFLCCNDWHHIGCRLCMDIPLTADKILSSTYLHGCQHRCVISVDRLLRTPRHPTNGDYRMAFGENDTYI